MVRNPIENMKSQYKLFNKKLDDLFAKENLENQKIVIWGAGHQSLFTISTSNIVKKHLILWIVLMKNKVYMRLDLD